MAGLLLHFECVFLGSLSHPAGARPSHTISEVVAKISPMESASLPRSISLEKRISDYYCVKRGYDPFLQSRAMNRSASPDRTRRALERLRVRASKDFNCEK